MVMDLVDHVPNVGVDAFAWLTRSFIGDIDQSMDTVKHNSWKTDDDDEDDELEERNQ